MYGQGRLTPFTLKFLQECSLDSVLAKLPVLIRPAPLYVLEAFALTPIENAKVVLLGQDPYPQGATGLSFSKKRGEPVTASLANMFACLTRSKFKVGNHCDLTYWARQGVLCINAALTLGEKSNDHAEIWKEFTKTLIGKLAALPTPPVLILLGGHAQKFARDDITCHVWGHPSPVATVNNDHNSPAAFYNCDVFTKTAHLVDWGLFPDSSMRLRGYDLPDDICETNGALWIFTDGAASKNGAACCRASWAFHATDGVVYYEEHGECAPIDIPGKEYKTSNLRGELLAILKGIQWCVYEAQNDTLCYVTKVTIVTDSMYSINMIENGYHAAFNEDLICYAQTQLATLKTIHPVYFLHQKAHISRKKMEAITDPQARFLWAHNNRADELATRVLNPQ